MDDDDDADDGLRKFQKWMRTNATLCYWVTFGFCSVRVQFLLHFGFVQLSSENQLISIVRIHVNVCLRMWLFDGQNNDESFAPAKYYRPPATQHTHIAHTQFQRTQFRVNWKTSMSKSKFPYFIHFRKLPKSEWCDIEPEDVCDVPASVADCIQSKLRPNCSIHVRDDATHIQRRNRWNDRTHRTPTVRLSLLLLLCVSTVSTTHKYLSLCSLHCYRCIQSSQLNRKISHFFIDCGRFKQFFGYNVVLLAMQNTPSHTRWRAERKQRKSERKLIFGCWTIYANYTKRLSEQNGSINNTIFGFRSSLQCCRRQQSN